MSDFLNWELTNRMHNLGYDGKTLMYIDDEEDIINDNSAELIGAKPAILTSAAFRWFREKYNLTSWVYNSDVDKFFYTILQNGRIIKAHNSVAIYEEAELACLQKLIQIIKDENN